MLTRLIYCSRAAAGFGLDDVRAILRSSRRNNERDDVTGALAFGEGAFLQVLEGDRRRLNELLRALVLDDRHDALTLMEFGPVEARRFAAWSMAFCSVEGRHAQIVLRHCSTRRFDPFDMSPSQAVAFLDALATAHAADPDAPLT